MYILWFLDLATSWQGDLSPAQRVPSSVICLKGADVLKHEESSEQYDRTFIETRRCVGKVFENILF